MKLNPQSPEEEILRNKSIKYFAGGTMAHRKWHDKHGPVVKKACGSRLWDFSGNEFIDYCLGSGPMLLGHAHPAVIKAVRQYLDRGTSYFLVNEPSILLAEEIVNAVPCADVMRLSLSGTDSNFYAIQAARAFRRKDKILKFEGSFHGMSEYFTMSAGTPASIRNEVLVAPFNDIDITLNIIEEHADELAAVIVEPFQRFIRPKPGFLEGLRQVTEHYQIPLIFDEVVTGFRWAYGGAQEYYGVTPDLAAYGKAMGGGFPVGALCGKEEIMAHFDPDMEAVGRFVPMGSTLIGNPIGAVAGLATLKELRREGSYDKLFATGTQLMESLQRILMEAELPAQVLGEPPVFDIVFTDKEVTDYRSALAGDADLSGRLNHLLLNKGILRASSGRFYVSLAHTSEDIKITEEAFSLAIEELKAEMEHA